MSVDDVVGGLFSAMSTDRLAAPEGTRSPTGCGQLTIAQAGMSLHAAREQFTCGRVLTGSAIRDTDTFAATPWSSGYGMAGGNGAGGNGAGDRIRAGAR